MPADGWLMFIDEHVTSPSRQLSVQPAMKIARLSYLVFNTFQGILLATKGADNSYISYETPGLALVELNCSVIMPKRRTLTSPLAILYLRIWAIV